MLDYGRHYTIIHPMDVDLNKGNVKLNPVELWELGKIIVKDAFHVAISLYKKVRYYKTSKNKQKARIILAIKTETNEERNRVENDLKRGLRNFLDSSNIPPEFDIVLTSPEESNTINESNSEVEKAAKHYDATIIIFGHLLLRDGNRHTFKLNALTRHKLTSKTNSNKLAKEMKELLPLDWNFPNNIENLGFEITADWMGLAIKYIVGITSFFNNSYQLALRIYMDLNKELSDSDQRLQTIPALRELKNKLPLRIFETCWTENQLLYQKFTKTRDATYIRMTQRYIEIMDTLTTLDRLKPLYANLKALYLFLAYRDVDQAIKIINKGVKSQDDTWRLNLAFLYAYKGKLKKTVSHYKNATHIQEPEVLSDCEIFMNEIISLEKTKYELLFARGCFNYLCKGDYTLATEDLNEFIRNATLEATYKEQRDLANAYLTDMTSKHAI